MLESKIYTALSGSTKITVTSSISTRIYPLIVPQESPFPVITYTRISGGQQNDLFGYSNLENPRIQIDCWAKTYKEVKTIAANVHDVMYAVTTFRAIQISDMDFYENDVELYRESMDFKIWNRE
jgi:hypothetical protein